MTTSSQQFGQSAISVVLNEGQMPAKITTSASGGVSLVGPDGRAIPQSLGEIALYGAETWNGSAFSGSGCVVPTSVFSGTSLGTTIAWSGTGGPVGSVDGVLFDTTAGGCFDPLQPERITIPAGVTFANFTGSVSFPATATGERWIRLVQGASTHMSSTVYPATTTPTIQNIQLNTGWIPVTAGEYYTLHVVQNSGVSITLAAGNYSNKGGSTFFRAAFK